MIIVSASDFRLKCFIKCSVKQIKKFDYESIIYDLGNLGFGCKIDDQKITTNSIHKPSLIKNAIDRTNKDKILVYIDADAFLINPIDEIRNDDFEIGVTERNPNEQNSKLGRINAGVMFFRITPALMEFLDRWELETKNVGDDQIALNSLLPKEKIKIKYYPTAIYNYYYYPDRPSNKVKIVHFKSDDKVRPYFYWDYMKLL